MTRLELIQRANEGYRSDTGSMGMESYFDNSTGLPVKGTGDGLAEFIVIELNETFDPDASDENQLGEARRVMYQARDELERVINALC